MGDDPHGSGRAWQRTVPVPIAHVGRGLQRAGSALEFVQHAGIRGKRSGLRNRLIGIRRGLPGIHGKLAGICPGLPGVRGWLTGLRRKLVAESGRTHQRGTGLRRGCIPRHGHGYVLLGARARRQRFPEFAPGQALGARYAATDERGRRTERVRAHGSRSRHQRSGVAALVGAPNTLGHKWPQRARRCRQGARLTAGNHFPLKTVPGRCGVGGSPLALQRYRGQTTASPPCDYARQWDLYG